MERDTPNRPHNSNTLICERHISSATLSGYRDGTLPPAEQRALAEHSRTCPACSRQLAEYETIAHLLRSQRELVPGDRIVSGVRQRATHTRQRRRARPASQVWRSVKVLGPIAAVLLLAVYIFGHVPAFRGTGPDHLTATATTSTATTPSATPTVKFSRVTTLASAWGAHGVKAQVTTAIDSTHVFDATAVTPDGRYLLGDELALVFAGNGQQQQRWQSTQVGMLDVQSKQFIPFGLPQPTNPDLPPASCCMTDGSFAVGSETDNRGANRPILRSLWSRALSASGDMRLVAKGTDYKGGIDQSLLSRGTLVFTTNNGSEAFMTNLDVRANTTIHPLPIATSQQGVPLSTFSYTFSWPYLVYFQTLEMQSGQTSVHVYNLSTQQNTTLSSSAAADIGAAAYASVVLVGNRLFYTIVDVSQGVGGHPVTNLYELDALNASAQPRAIATYAGDPGPCRTGNARLLICQSAAWDFSLNEWVTFPHATATTAADTGLLATNAAGSTLAVIHPNSTLTEAGGVLYPMANGALPDEQITLYDTSQLP